MIGDDKEDMLKIDHVYIHPKTKQADRKEFWNFVIAERSDKHIILGDINEKARILGGGNTKVYSSFDDLLIPHNYSVFNNGLPTREQKHLNG